MKTKPVAEDPKRIRRSIMAYLQGAKDLAWIIKILSAADLQSARLFVGKLTGYGDPARYEQVVTRMWRNCPGGK